MGTHLSDFRGHGVLSRIHLEDGSRQADLRDVQTFRDFEHQISAAGFERRWSVTLLEVCCDFSMKQHDNATFHREHARLQSELQTNSPVGVRRSLVTVDNSLRAVIEIVGSQVPAVLETLDGWRTFRFESLRTMFQFKASTSTKVDEEFHERIRHVLRNLTRNFHQAGSKH
jgi:hypothetical protein